MTRLVRLLALPVVLGTTIALCSLEKDVESARPRLPDKVQQKLKQHITYSAWINTPPRTSLNGKEQAFFDIDAPMLRKDVLNNCIVVVYTKTKVNASLVVQALHGTRTGCNTSTDTPYQYCLQPGIIRILPAALIAAQQLRYIIIYNTARRTADMPDLYNYRAVCNYYDIPLNGMVHPIDS